MIEPRPVRALDRTLYMLFAAAVTLAVARAFYGYMLLQTHGEWSAPLDDVFIHFDYARSTARGFPFQWSPGNGYSSGNTSILYPFALAFGYLAGFREQMLVVWAGILACLSVSLYLTVAARLFSSLSFWAKYLAPPALFTIGALDWSLWSGMEVSFYLGIWALALRATLRSIDRRAAPATPPAAASRWARFADAVAPFELGIYGAFLVLTRPEGVTSLGALAILSASDACVRRELRRAAIIVARAVIPAAFVLVLQAAINRWLTGEFAASGALVKLTLYNPYMTAEEKWNEYLFLLKYVVRRNTEYHFTDHGLFGYIVVLFALIPLCFQSTRRVAATLWLSIITWLAVVAFNAQVRWQNERYTMPAVAWVLLLAAMGVAQMIDPAGPLGAGAWFSRRGWARAGYVLRSSGALALVVLFLWHQEPRLRDQLWFFGRASRNIRDQHVTAGRLLRDMTPPPRRVLVGDAGALIYASDLPGLDLIGLGGYHDLPFARAGVHGLGATLELIERMPASDRPDAFALYPSWWGSLPQWFGQEVAQVPVYGNVICGGAEKVIYRADWRGLGRGAKPCTMRDGETIIDELDVADLVSEGQHDYEFPHPSAGFVEARLLPDPADDHSDMFDAGRRIPPGRIEKFRLRLPSAGARLVARTASEHDLDIEVSVDGQSRGVLHFSRADGWREASIELPAGDGRRWVTLMPRRDDWVDHHVWVVQSP